MNGTCLRNWLKIVKIGWRKGCSHIELAWTSLHSADTNVMACFTEHKNNLLCFGKDAKLEWIGEFTGTLSSIIENWDVFWQWIITEPWEFGRDLKDNPIPTPLLCQGHLPLNQVIQNLIQPGLEYLQGWGIYRFLGNLCQCLATLTVKNLLLISNLNFPSFSLCPLLFVPSVVPDDESLSSFHTGPFSTGEFLWGFHRTFSLPGWTAPTFSACLQRRAAPVLCNFVAFSGLAPALPCHSLCWGHQNSMQ